MKPAPGVELLGRAEALLSTRDCSPALNEFYRAEVAGADRDRCAAGRWMCPMLRGQYEQAWHESDGSRERGAADPHRFWHGEPIRGKRVMLRCLHGYGDTVMYLRWLPLLRAQAGQVLVQAAPEMLPLLQRIPDAGRILTWTAEEQSDVHLWEVQVECAELPFVFRANPATLPPPTRFAFSEAERHRTRSLLGQRTRPRVGLVWTGSSYDPARSIPFEQLKPLLANHGVEFWSLQARENNAKWEQHQLERGWSARTFYTAGGSHAGIADMAALAAELDLVITIDTLAAHLAGSLGLPTWLLLKREADWRWMMDRDDSPWYPTMRLFRQRESGHWEAVITQVCERLRDWCEEQRA